ncbi:MAG: (d)CMP kinase [Ignavibacteriales bacterium]
MSKTGIRKMGLIRIGIDGPAGAGKSTLARRLSRELGVRYVDTGAMYRALTFKVLEAGVDPADADQVVSLAEKTRINLEPRAGSGEQMVMMDGRDVTREIRSPDVNRWVSVVARHPRVRELMVRTQQAMACDSVIMEGRDICTRVMPDAELKIFLTADLHERARRRHKELVEKGYSPSIREVEAEMAARDRIDSGREKDPLRPAEDSVIVDSTGMTPEEVTRAVLRLCEGGSSCSTGS